MNLDLDKWGSFRISDLFPILQNGKANQGMLSDGTECFYVGAKKNDNGVMLHCAYDEDLILFPIKNAPNPLPTSNTDDCIF